jgi:ATP-dependent Lhr-like helicase
MGGNPFDRLAPFVQEYIYRNNWTRLQDIQVEAIGAILDSPDHVLISSGTATGKTEAALLPIITDLHNNPPAAIGALYIGPLKALINDQFERITDLLEASAIPVQSWHGDVPHTKKRRFLQRAQGILQITPESLEAMLINRQHALKRLFHDTRYVIIDEIHAFSNSDRGRQVICQLERLARYQTQPMRRIGLSATIGDPRLTREFLRGNTKLPVQLITSKTTSAVEIGLEYYPLPADGDGAIDDAGTEARVGEAGKKKKRKNKANRKPTDEAGYYAHFHKMTQRVPKTLIFANARAETEEIIVNLRRLSERKRQPSFYHVHHGSISAPLREAAEAAMKDQDQQACAAATITLELGIDLGLLDQVIQVNSTHSVSSFVQRLGRSGRRGGPSRLFFYSIERPVAARHIGEELPWNLLQTIAIIQLYAEEKWIEPPEVPQMPMSLLYHQTMSIIKSHGELSPPQLAQRVLSLSPFQAITQDQFRRLLRRLLEIEHLETTERGDLILGVEAERIVNNYRFYAVFEDDTEYRVRDKSHEIGTIQAAPEVDSTIALAGYAWRVLSVDEDRRVIEARRVSGKTTKHWSGADAPIHARILQKMRAILLSRDSYPYLRARAKERLQSARETARRSRLSEESILPLAPGKYLIFPWCGTRQYATQLLALEHAGVKTTGSCSPYYYELECKAQTVAALKRQLAAIGGNAPAALALSERMSAYHRAAKYDRYVTTDLLHEAVARDYVDIAGAIESIKRL